MLKKFSIAVGSLFAVLVVACSNGGVEDVAGGTIDPSTIALNSSSSGDVDVSSSSLSETENGMSVSESSSSSDASDTKIVQDESSSSGDGNSIKPNFRSSSGNRIVDESSSSDEGENKGVDPIPVSSSSEIRDGGIARTGDFSIQCIVDVINVKLDDPAVAADVAPPQAFKHVEDDFVKFDLQGVYLDIPCDKGQRDEYLDFLNTDKTFPIGHEGDTLYVTPLQSKGVEYACSCAAEATFTLDKNYSGINYTVFGQKETLPVKEN